MSFQAFPYNMPLGAFLDNKSGQPSQDWWRFFLSLFNRTGAGDGIDPVVQTGLAAAGTGQSNALGLTADWNQVDSGSGGVVMPAMKPGNDITVFNNTGGNLNVYPFSGAAIDGGAVNAALIMPAGQMRKFECWTTTQMRTAYHTP
jgi:hypothetical protein